MSQTSTAAPTPNAVRIRQTVVLLFCTLISLVGVFPYHLLSVFPLLAALSLMAVVRWLRLAVGAVSVGLLVLGAAAAAGIS